MNFYKKLLTKLQDNQNVYLLTVVENIGSSPGRQGFKMFVSEDGFISGSIGGGIMEYQFVEKVKTDLKADKLEVLFKRQIHQGKGKKDSSGMICSGEQTVVFHPLNTNDIPVIENIINNLEKNKKGTLELNQKGLFFSEEILETHFKFQNQEKWTFKEQIGYKEIFYIVGGGHVGLATSQIMNYLGFYVVIFDNRKDLNTLVQNEFAHEKHIVDYQEINQYIEPNNFVAIMTSKFVDDKQILSQIIKKQHRFLGVLGSKVKINTMFSSLLEDGFSKEQLNKVFAPIGYPIKSQTPEEIAISIAAQVVEVKNALL
jgi:xanthine dehydrogenase accessory factor